MVDPYLADRFGQLYERNPTVPARSVLAQAKRLRYGSVKEIWKDFCGKTSTHGVPWIEASRSHIGACFWIILTIVTVIASVLNGYFLLYKFFQWDKVAQMQIIFGSVPFPAVTICNLNPYKNSLIPEDMKRSFNVYGHMRSTHSKQKIEQTQAQPVKVEVSSTATADQLKEFDEKYRRALKRDVPDNETIGVYEMWHQHQHFAYQPALTYCSCRNFGTDCVPLPKYVEQATEKCYCFNERHSNSLWPCFHYDMWRSATCTQCQISGRCNMPEENQVQKKTHGQPVPCLCQLVSHYCVVQPRDIKMYPNVLGEIPTRPPTTPSPYAIKKLGLGDVKGESSLHTKAKENVIIQVVNMELEERKRLSYSRQELLHMCSFDGEECDIEEDFSLHIDPVYGNCYMYNYEAAIGRNSTRAGPLYGMRLLAYSNVSDYIPTTEASGIRLTIHAQTDHPFPDIFGFSAPTGTVSSFGLKMTHITRLAKPYGDCQHSVAQSTESHYIFNTSYSVEGCYRSCFQHALLKECECADPRFPLPLPNTSICSEISERRCLDEYMKEIGDFRRVSNCKCKQPCDQIVYTVSYSAATWPAFTYAIGECESGNRSCIQVYRENAVMVEVYFEQVSYEVVEEKEAYGIVNLLADMGGQIGLWLGLSIITVIEWLVLSGNLCLYGLYSKKTSERRRRSLIHEDFENNNATYLQSETQKIL